MMCVKHLCKLFAFTLILKCTQAKPYLGLDICDIKKLSLKKVINLLKKPQLKYETDIQVLF